MRKLVFALVLLLVAIFAVQIFAQTGDPRPPRTTWKKELDYIKNGSFTFTYKTLTSPTLSGTSVTNSATTNYNTGTNWYWAIDGDTLKINV
jgi:hypothetical protein